MLLSNLPMTGIFINDVVHEGVTNSNELADAGIFSIFYMLKPVLPSLIFLGVGAMTDFGPLIANPKSLLMGAAAQLGIFFAFFSAIALGFNAQEAGSIGIIGGADGPTAIYLTTKLADHLVGRQGDPGKTVFCVSMEDDLMRLFGGDRMQGIVRKLGVEEDEAIESGMVSKQIENAQKKVEGRNFGIRKYVLQYDNVMNKQREIIYGERKKVLFGEDLREDLDMMTRKFIDEVVDPIVIASKYPEEDFETAIRAIYNAFVK